MRFILLLLTFPAITGFVFSQPVFHFPVTLPGEIKAYAGNDTTIILGQSVTLGAIPAAAGGYGNYIYSWQPASTLDDPSLPNPLATPVVTTAYTLTVSDGENCSAMASVTVTVDTLSGIPTRPYISPVIMNYGEDLYIQTYFASPYSLIITEISGRQLTAGRVEEGTGQRRLEMNSGPGMYLITVHGNDFVYQTKCIKL
jgi:hypothetical protein